MIALKLLGALLILGVGAICARGATQYEKKRIRVIDGWIDLIFYIRSKIDCYLMPLGEILAEGRQTLPEFCIPQNESTDLHAILRASAVYLDGDAKSLLESFVREIGNSYREEQVRRCDYYITALRNLREKSASELPMRLRLSVTISLCVALGAAVLLW
ncbi:MAG: hypothetical protein IJX80_09435 [Clostridia bacterium]|nr:hypothetical protein [Clostridia bacterium]